MANVCANFGHFYATGQFFFVANGQRLKNNQIICVTLLPIYPPKAAFLRNCVSLVLQKSPLLLHRLRLLLRRHTLSKVGQILIEPSRGPRTGWGRKTSLGAEGWRRKSGLVCFRRRRRRFKTGLDCCKKVGKSVAWNTTSSSSSGVEHEGDEVEGTDGGDWQTEHLVSRYEDGKRRWGDDGTSKEERNDAQQTTSTATTTLKMRSTSEKFDRQESSRRRFAESRLSKNKKWKKLRHFSIWRRQSCDGWMW